MFFRTINKNLNSLYKFGNRRKFHSFPFQNMIAYSCTDPPTPSKIELYPLEMYISLQSGEGEKNCGKNAEKSI
jgi:hypothetical protein